MYPEISSDVLPHLEDKVRMLESYRQVSNSVLVLFSVKDFKLIYASSNIEEVFGYSNEEVIQTGAVFFFNVLEENHIDFPIVRLELEMKAKQELNATFIQKSFCSGLKVRHKNGPILRCLIQRLYLENEKGEALPLFLNIIHDVSHLMKGDHYWLRYLFNESSVFYHSDFKEKIFPDMVSSRELEVLDLIDKNKSSKEIASILNISQNTVEKHRKNMIKRLGVKDSTALLQICKMCGVF